MSDIVKRLRVGGDGPCDCEILGEAADEIERLRAECMDLRAALDRIMVGDDAVSIARAALEGK